MRWCVQSDEQSVLFGAERGCAEFEQRVLRFDGAGAGETAAADDEVLYVLSGRGSATVAGQLRGARSGHGGVRRRRVELEC